MPASKHNFRDIENYANYRAEFIVPSNETRTCVTQIITHKMIYRFWLIYQNKREIPQTNYAPARHLLNIHDSQTWLCIKRIQKFVKQTFYFLFNCHCATYTHIISDIYIYIYYIYIYIYYIYILYIYILYYYIYIRHIYCIILYL